MENQQLQKWALIAEIIGAFAVVLSLIYLAFEVNENTRVLEASSRQELASQDIAYLSSALDSTILAGAIAKTRSGQELTPLEESQMTERQHLNFRVFENAFYQTQIGALEESEWERYEGIIRALICNNRYAQKMWDRNMTFQPGFRQTVDMLGQECGNN